MVKAEVRMDTPPKMADGMAAVLFYLMACVLFYAGYDSRKVTTRAQTPRIAFGPWAAMALAVLGGIATTIWITR